MLRGPTPPKWFAPHIKGAFRVREYEIFIRDITTTIYCSNYIIMEANFKHNYSRNCAIENKGIWKRFKARMKRPSNTNPKDYLPMKTVELKQLASYLTNKGLYTKKAITTLNIHLDFLKRKIFIEQEGEE